MSISKGIVGAWIIGGDFNNVFNLNDNNWFCGYFGRSGKLQNLHEKV